MSLLQKLLVVVFVLFALFSTVEGQKTGKKAAPKKPEPKKVEKKGKKPADEDDDADDDDEEEAKPKGKKPAAPKKAEPAKPAAKPTPAKAAPKKKWSLDLRFDLNWLLIKLNKDSSVDIQNRNSFFDFLK